MLAYHVVQVFPKLIKGLLFLRHLPLARDLVRVARQQLVGRLDGYMSKRNAPIFRRVLKIIDDEVPAIHHGSSSFSHGLCLLLPGAKMAGYVKHYANLIHHVSASCVSRTPMESPMMYLIRCACAPPPPPPGDIPRTHACAVFVRLLPLGAGGAAPAKVLASWTRRIQDTGRGDNLPPTLSIGLVSSYWCSSCHSAHLIHPSQLHVRQSQVSACCRSAA